MYGDGRADEIVGEAIADRRAEVLLTTLVMPSGASYDETLRVFDWEYAFAGAPPLFDLLHFHLIAPAGSGRLLSARDMRRALAPAKAFALLAYPDADWSNDVVSALGLAYLLHTLLFYGESRGELVESHPVVRSYCGLIEERASWRS